MKKIAKIFAAAGIAFHGVLSADAIALAKAIESGSPTEVNSFISEYSQSEYVGDAIIYLASNGRGPVGHGGPVGHDGPFGQGGGPFGQGGGPFGHGGGPFGHGGGPFGHGGGPFGHGGGPFGHGHHGHGQYGG
jgi:hypothetical protein